MKDKGKAWKEQYMSWHVKAWQVKTLHGKGMAWHGTSRTWQGHGKTWQ
jgi:hypothetical protein